MNKPQLLIIGTSKDLHIDYVLKYLHPHVSYCRLNIDEYPVSTTLNFESRSTSSVSLTISTNEGSYDLASVKTVWFRRIGAPTIDDRIAVKAHRVFAAGETEAAISSLAHLLQGCHWISPYEATKRASSKLYQLKMANKCGLKSPRTLMTNDPHLAKNFIASIPRVIYKTLHSPSVIYEDKRALIFSHLIDDADMAFVDQVRYAPCQFQEYVEKAYELRITITGTQLFTVKIDSQSNEIAKTDWRAGLGQDLRYERSILPSEVEDRLLQLSRKLGLLYGAVDMIVTPENEYVFLEINPHGAWGWLERELAIPISEQFAKYISESILS